LAWFDDQRGIFVGDRTPCITGEFVVEVPETEPGTPPGFGKSIAFLIQPVGLTPKRHFEPLPNEFIGQISIEDIETDPQSGEEWHEEEMDINSGEQNKYVFYVRTKPDLDDPNTPENEWDEYYYKWSFGDFSSHGEVQGQGLDTVTNVYFTSALENSSEEVSVHIYRDNQYTARVTGDIIYVIDPQPE